MTTMTIADRRNNMSVIAAGVALGVLYTLSPLTVLCTAVLCVATWWAGRDLTYRERQFFFSFLTLAIAARLLVIAGLFLFADPARPFGTFFGDEEIFKSRTIWLRNVGLGVPISSADVIYAFSETGMSGHLYVLAYLQALVGDAPYGLHVFNAAVYVVSTLIMFRVIRPSYGRTAAMGGLALLLFLPSLFSWSISALKEPFYTLLAVLELVCVIQVVRAPRVWQRALAAAAVVVSAFLLEELRKGGMQVAAIGGVAGLGAGLTITRPRLAVAAAVAVVLVLAAGLSRPSVQHRLLELARDSATYHSGHVLTPGYSYKTLEGRYYLERLAIREMPAREAAAFAVKSVISYVVEPLPWKSESRALLAYLPEQILWLVTIALVPFGLAAGLRRDPLLTCVLGAHALAVMLMVALTSGNIGTLIRHRGLALTYLAWLAALGAVAVAGWLTRTPTAASEGTNLHGDR